MGGCRPGRETPSYKRTLTRTRGEESTSFGIFMIFFPLEGILEPILVSFPATSKMDTKWAQTIHLSSLFGPPAQPENHIRLTTVPERLTLEAFRDIWAVKMAQIGLKTGKPQSDAIGRSVVATTTSLTSPRARDQADVMQSSERQDALHAMHVLMPTPPPRPARTAQA